MFIVRMLTAAQLCISTFGYTQQSGAVTVINDVNVIPMTQEIVIPHQRIVITGNTITTITTINEPMPVNISTLIDGRGKYVIPGLSEMHYHYRNHDMASDLKLLVANGITTVRNMAATAQADQLKIRDSIRRALLLPVNYYTTGPYLQSRDLGTQSEVRKVVSDHATKGFDFLKIADNLPAAIYVDLLRLCDSLRIPVVGHAQRLLPLEYSMRMKSIEHIEELMYIPSFFPDRNFGEEQDSVLNKLASALQQSGVYLGTTLSGFEFITNCLDDERFNKLQQSPLKKYLAADQRKAFLSEQNDYRKLRHQQFNGKLAAVAFDDYFKWIKKMAGFLNRHHVPLLTGSDTYGMTIVGFSLHREFALLLSCGLTPYEILLASTVNPARYLGIYAITGTIAPGKSADLVMLEDNPLKDIRNTEKIAGVLLKGKWMDAGNLSGMLNEVGRAFR